MILIFDDYNYAYYCPCFVFFVLILYQMRHEYIVY